MSPDVVCRIGELPTSKPLRNWIAGLDQAHHILFAPNERWSDPAARVTQRIVGSLEDLLERVEHDEVVADDSDWLDRWSHADSAVARAIAEPLMDAGLSEPATVTALAQFLPPSTTLFVGSSMPIRDVEEFFPALNEPPRVLANRGANGSTERFRQPSASRPLVRVRSCCCSATSRSRTTSAGCWRPAGSASS